MIIYIDIIFEVVYNIKRQTQCHREEEDSKTSTSHLKRLAKNKREFNNLSKDLFNSNNRMQTTLTLISRETIKKFKYFLFYSGIGSLWERECWWRRHLWGFISQAEGWHGDWTQEWRKKYSQYWWDRWLAFGRIGKLQAQNRIKKSVDFGWGRRLRNRLNSIYRFAASQRKTARVDSVIEHS